jgi:hypothetical protein
LFNLFGERLFESGELDRYVFPEKRLLEAMQSPEAETFRELGEFVVLAGVRYAASLNPYTAAAMFTYHVYDTVDEWILSALPEWAKNP